MAENVFGEVAGSTESTYKLQNNSTYSCVRQIVQQ